MIFFVCMIFLVCDIVWCVIFLFFLFFICRMCSGVRDSIYIYVWERENIFMTYAGHITCGIPIVRAVCCSVLQCVVVRCSVL